MKLSKQVTSVELSNELHKLGVIEPSIYFREWTGAKEDEIEMWEKPDYCPDNVNCYTLAELFKLLPVGFYLGKDREYYYCGASSEYLPDTNPKLADKLYEMDIEIDQEQTEDEENPADCVAKMIIYLLENKLIKGAV